MPSQSLNEQFPFKSSDLIWRQLRLLTAAVEARLQGVEAQADTYDDEITKFEELGLAAVNAAISPLVTQGIARLTSVTDIFSAQSTTTNTVGLGAKQFVVPGEERWTFAPLMWVGAYANNQAPGVYAGMVARVVSWDDATGSLNIDSTIADGAGTYSDWTITASAPPAASGVTAGQMNSAITAAVNAVVNGAPAGLDTLDELAAAINDNATYYSTVATALNGKQPLATLLTALAALVPSAGQLPYFTSAGAMSLLATSAYMRSLMTTADASALKTVIGAASMDVESQALTGGAYVVPKDLGTVTTGTLTPDPGDRPMQYYTNNGAHTLAPGVIVGSYLLDITNGASAGTITTSGWTKVTGDPITLTVGHKFTCACKIGQAGSLLQVQAMQ